MQETERKDISAMPYGLLRNMNLEITTSTSPRKTLRDMRVKNPSVAHVFAVVHPTNKLHRMDSLTKRTAQNISQQDMSDIS